MNSKYILLGGALVTTLTFAGCQPQSTMNTTTTTQDDTAMVASPDPMASGSPAAVEEGVMVGGALMMPSRPIPVNAADAPNLTTLVAAVKQAGLVETLSGPGPFTVFAPTNAAFEKVPAATLTALMTPAKKADLTKLLTYHVVAGNYTSADLKDGMKLKTVQGEELTVVVAGGKVMIKDAKGGTANIETADVMQSNGVVHVVDAVLMP